MAVRLNKRPKSIVTHPQSHDDWHRLMVAALDAATKANDPRVSAMRLALAKGQTEQHLRKLGIICLADLQREFPRAT